MKKIFVILLAALFIVACSDDGSTNPTGSATGNCELAAFVQGSITTRTRADCTTNGDVLTLNIPTTGARLATFNRSSGEYTAYAGAQSTSVTGNITVDGKVWTFSASGTKIATVTLD